MAKDSTLAKAPAQAKASNTPEPTPPAAKGKTTPGLWVEAKVDGFRRAGIAWPKAGVGIALSALTKAQVKELRAEPKLTVTDIEIPAAGAQE
jgi:hypothetical protein